VDCQEVRFFELVAGWTGFGLTSQVRHLPYFTKGTIIKIRGAKSASYLRRVK